MYTIDSVVPFDMLIDTDMGLLKLIQREYCNYSIFRKPILEERNMDIMKMILTERTSYDPIIFFSNPGKEEDVKDLYKQFMDSRYESILKYSCNTGIFNIVRRSKSVEDSVKFTIVCKSELEHKVILERFSKCGITPKIKMESDLDISSYSNIYVKNYMDILSYDKIEGKNIIIGNYGFNMEDGIKGIPLREVTEKIIGSNTVKIIDIYPLSESKISVG